MHIVIECIKDIGNVPLVDKYGVLIQTTFELAKFEEILAALQKERSGEYKIEKNYLPSNVSTTKGCSEVS